MCNSIATCGTSVFGSSVMQVSGEKWTPRCLKEISHNLNFSFPGLCPPCSPPYRYNSPRTPTTILVWGIKRILYKMWRLCHEWMNSNYNRVKCRFNDRIQERSLDLAGAGTMSRESHISCLEHLFFSRALFSYLPHHTEITFLTS